LRGCLLLHAAPCHLKNRGRMTGKPEVIERGVAHLTRLTSSDGKSCKVKLGDYKLGNSFTYARTRCMLSPAGHPLAFITQEVLQANIGMLENIR
jgi:hypothetical protein